MNYGSIMNPEKRYWLLARSEWKVGFGLSGIVGIPVALITFQMSPWISIIVAMTVLVAYHMACAARYIVPLPHVVILVSALQYVLAGWIGTYFPPLGTLQDTSLAFPFYMTYAGPVILAITFAWFLCLPRKLEEPPLPSMSNAVLFELDILIVIGLGASIASRVVKEQGEFAFVIQLVASLRYVGVFGRMIGRARGVWWRLTIVMAAEVFFAVNATMFHPLLLWGMWSLAVWLFAFQPARRAVFIALAIACLLMPALQEAKWRLRGSLEDEISEPNEDNVGSTVVRTIDWFEYLGVGVVDTLTLRLSPDFLADTAARYNQGWIITRVMFFVPTVEPYAMGDTLMEAVRAAAVPRLFDPNKLKAGGHEFMARYAGMELNESTSMNLGYAGEMYANFGFVGGVVGCGCYALLAALAFRKMAKYAVTHPMWWSVIPFVFFPIVKAEDDIAFVLNWAIKGAVVLAAVVVLLPNLRRSLFASTFAAGPVVGGRKLPGLGSQSR
jgi:hypothetical protein